MANLLLMPEIAANAVDAMLANWLVSEGSPIASGQALAVIETEKAAVDLEAEADGVLIKLLVSNGATVLVGAPIALIGAPGESLADIDLELARLGIGAQGQGQMTAGQAQAAPSEATASVASAPIGLPISGSRIFASPLARRLARDSNIGLDSIIGSGPGGRIVRRDVTAAIALGPVPSSPPMAVTTTVPTAAAGSGAFTDIPHTRMRQAIAARLTLSKQSAPHFYVKGSCRVDALLAARVLVNERTPQKASINDWIIKAIAKAHTLVPQMNVIWTADAVRQFSDVDVAVAIATDTGLLTPVLRSADKRTLADLASSVQDFATRARSGQIEPHELDGGAITVTNLGMFGVEEFAAILNPPQSAILAVGAITREPVVDGETVAIASVMRVVLSVDHRPVDGVTAARWMKEFVTLMENPVLIVS
ncbi:MAG: dihydrolipoamide acetyltransferase family protein [Candidatus Nanopelagicales bacterium]